MKETPCCSLEQKLGQFQGGYSLDILLGLIGGHLMKYLTNRLVYFIAGLKIIDTI